MDTIEMTGKTVDEAVEKALASLEAGRDAVTVTVLDPGSKGFLGLGQKPAKVSVKLNFDPERVARRYLHSICAAIGISAEIKIDLTERLMKIELIGSRTSSLIGKHGATLDALQYLTSLVVNKTGENFINVYIDTENYREKRRETLENLARNIARKVKQTRKSVRLEPMTSAERRVIHSALQGDRYVTTFSEGNDPYRYVVVAPRREGQREQGQGFGTTYGGGNKDYRSRGIKTVKKVYGYDENEEDKDADV